ncbi:hypothetical protein KKC52_08295 [bacterium]|nr:hypothetical protein [bacterium]
MKRFLRRPVAIRLKAAKILGMNRNTLHSKIKRLKIDVKGI